MKRAAPKDGPVSMATDSSSIAPNTDGSCLTSGLPLHRWLADASNVPAERLAYVAVVEIAEGKYRRRPYLTLAAAQRAVERAEARGVTATVTLCELVPVRGEVG